MSKDLLQEGILTQAIGSPISHLGPYSSTTSHTQLLIKTDTKLQLPTSMVSNTFRYGSE